LARNVEIKARIADLDQTHAAVARISTKPPQLIEQEDVFFNVATGRLKLRILSPSHGELIFYQREDKIGPKTCTYHIHRTDKPEELRAVLSAACGEKIIIRKQRHLYFSDRTRIHIDVVENLGKFIELEVVLEEYETPDSGESEAQALMEQLGIEADHLVEVAYADLLEGK